MDWISTDVGFYRAVVEQMQHGVSYHHATWQAIRATHFATWCDVGPGCWLPVSRWNWRPPLLYRVLAFLPVHRIPIWAFWCEVWSGLALGFAAATGRWPRARAAFALLALLLRELAGPAVLIFALADRRRWRMWLAVFCVAGIYYVLHWQAVAEATPIGTPGGSTAEWLTLGGLPLLLNTMVLSPPALLWPGVGTWIWLTLVILSLCVRRVATPVRVIVGCYLGLFSLIGLEAGGFYWGCMMLPLQTLAMWKAVR